MPPRAPSSGLRPVAGPLRLTLTDLSGVRVVASAGRSTLALPRDTGSARAYLRPRVAGSSVTIGVTPRATRDRAPQTSPLLTARPRPTAEPPGARGRGSGRWWFCFRSGRQLELTVVLTSFRYADARETGTAGAGRARKQRCSLYRGLYRARFSLTINPPVAPIHVCDNTSYY